MARECGKNITECRAEVVEGLHMVQYVFGTGRMPIGDIVASEIPEKDAFVRRKPWGVVGRHHAVELPVRGAAVDARAEPARRQHGRVQAIEDTPAIGQRLVELFVEAGFPAGTINLVHGDGVSRAKRWCRNAGVNVVLFTGSYEVGKQIQQVVGRAARPHRSRRDGQQERGDRLRRRPARPGGDGAASSARSRRPASAACRRAGMLVHESSDRPLRRERSWRRRSGCSIGDPLDPTNFAGPVIQRDAVEKVLSYNALAEKEGGEVLLDGGRMTDAAHANGCYLSPFVYRHRAQARRARASARKSSARTWRSSRSATNEDAVRIYNDTDYGLSLAVITERLPDDAASSATSASSAWAT